MSDEISGQDADIEIKTRVGYAATISVAEPADGKNIWICNPPAGVSVSATIESDEGDQLARKFMMVAEKAGEYVIPFSQQESGQGASAFTIALKVQP